MNLMKKTYYLITLVLSLIVFGFMLTGCDDISAPEDTSTEAYEKIDTYGDGDSQAAKEATEYPEDEAGGDDITRTTLPPDRDGTYTSKEDVANYLIFYGEFPQNFITKKEARELGWSGGSLEPYAPGKCIGGDRYGNYEGILPVKKGLTYRECDIDTLGKRKRGAKRIIYSSDGKIYYTNDHYETFTLLYEEGYK